MSGPDRTMSLERARKTLRLEPGAAPQEVRRAFREAVKRTHPDRPGGSAEAFRDVVEAFHLLDRAPADEAPASPPPRSARPSAQRAGESGWLEITPEQAANGGEIELATADRRTLRLRVPAGLRAGDKVRCEGRDLQVVVRGDGQVIVRGDDLWITAMVDPELFKRGGRLSLETPLGRRIIWITQKAAAERLVRLQGQGLPARGRHRQGHLFVRLEPAAKGATGAAAMRERFTAAWIG